MNFRTLITGTQFYVVLPGAIRHVQVLQRLLERKTERQVEVESLSRGQHRTYGSTHSGAIQLPVGVGQSASGVREGTLRTDREYFVCKSSVGRVDPAREVHICVDPIRVDDIGLRAWRAVVGVESHAVQNGAVGAAG